MQVQFAPTLPAAPMRSAWYTVLPHSAHISGFVVSMASNAPFLVGPFGAYQHAMRTVRCMSGSIAQVKHVQL